MQVEEFDFLKYLNSNGLYYYANIIEEFLLSLKLNNIIFLNGISGLDKTNLVEYYCRYFIESINSIKTIESTSTIGKTKTSKGFAVKRDDLIKILPKISYEDQCEFIVDNIKVKARLNIQPRLFFKPSENEEFYNYLDDAKENGIKKVTYNILLKDAINSIYKIFDANVTNKNSSEIIEFIKKANLNKTSTYFIIFNKVTEENILSILFYKLEIPDNVYVFYCGTVENKIRLIQNVSFIDFKALSPIDYLQNNTQNIYFKNVEYLIKNERNFINEIDVIKNYLQKIALNEEDTLYSIILNELNKLYYILIEEDIYLTNHDIKYILNYMLIAWHYENEPDIFNNWKKYFDLQLIQRVIPHLYQKEVSVDLLTKLLHFCDDQFYYNRSYDVLCGLLG